MTDSFVTACTMDCPDACSLLVEKDLQGMLRIRGNPDHPFTRGFTCAKIKRHPMRLRHPARILHPMVRRQGNWETISWDEALDLCAEKVQELRHEPASLLHLPSDGAKGVLKRGVGLLFDQLGSSRVRGSLCDAAGYTAYVRDFGSRENHRAEDLLSARTIVNWGKDFSRSSVHLAALVRKARKVGARVFSISPGGDGNGSFSDRILRIRPGTDRFLAAAVIRQLVEQGLVPDAVACRTRNWNRFSEELSAWSSSALLSRCGVSEPEARELFQWYADNGPVATIVGAGIQRYQYGGENVRFINALALVSGNVGRSGGGSYFHLHSFANLDLSWSKSSERRSRRTFATPRVAHEILHAHDPKVRMLWMNGSNFVNQAPNIRKTLQAFESVPFKVVVEAFMTDTADRADLILPCTLMLEQEDIVGSYLHPYIQWVSAVSKPPGEARDDYTIVRDLGRRLDPPIPMPTKEEAFRASLDSPVLEVSLETLRRERFAEARRPDIPYEGLRFAHKDGLFHLPDTLHPEPEPPTGYPLRLLTLVRRNTIHSQRLPDSRRTVPTAWISPETLKTLGVEAGRQGTLTSPEGCMRVVTQELDGLHPEVVLCRRGGWLKHGEGANQLIKDRLTDLGNGAAFYDQYVRLEPVEEEDAPCP